MILIQALAAACGGSLIWALLAYLVIPRKQKGKKLKCFGMLVGMLTLFGYPISLLDYVCLIDVIYDYNTIWFIYCIATTFISAFLVQKKINVQ